MRREPETCEGARLTEEEKCAKFLDKTCGYKLVNKKSPCSSQFSMEYILDIRAQAALLSHDQLDMALMGGIMAGMNKNKDITHGQRKVGSRQRTYTEHSHNGLPVCVVTFAFLHGIGQRYRLSAITEHYAANGLTPRVHKNTGRLPANAMT